MTKEEAIKIINQHKSEAEYHLRLTQVLSSIEDELLNIQAFNMAVEALKIDLVRCGECKYQDSCSELGEKIEVDDYCSFGKRKNDD